VTVLVLGELSHEDVEKMMIRTIKRPKTERQYQKVLFKKNSWNPRNEEVKIDTLPFL